jgi:hypothetical protein
MSTFKGLLGTDNKKEQLEKIEALLKIVATPEITLILQYNGITDQVTLNISGGDVAFDTIHRALELAGRAIRREEVNIAVQQQEQDGEDKKTEE